MSRWLAPFCAIAIPASMYVGMYVGIIASSPANAQDVYGPAADPESGEDDTPVPLIDPEPCENEVREDGAIIVCRERLDSERYMLPLPRPVEVHINDLGGLHDPPCWVTQGESLGCMRVGYVPPYPPIIDFDQFPDDLSEEHAALVSAVPDEDQPVRAAPTGERVAIDLSDDN